MKDYSIANKPFLVFKGLAIEAVYSKQQIPEYRNNPLIEALPPIWSKKQVTHKLAHYPPLDKKLRRLQSEQRLHLVKRAARFFQPLPHHLDLEQMISITIREGYLARNPVTKGFWKNLAEKVEAVKPVSKAQTFFPSSASGFYVVGISGIGKTWGIEAILSLYPQVIDHSEYKGEKFTYRQVVWLKLDCPADLSLKALCISFFQTLDSILGTTYYKDYGGNGGAPVKAMVPMMARVSALHSIGLLVIDEVQNLDGAHSGGSTTMLNYLVELINTIGMPVVLIGTFKALPVLMKEFRQARRGTGQGSPIWKNMQEDEIWKSFLRALWKYQYTSQEAELTTELAQLMYLESQGITDLAVKIFIEAQKLAINMEQPKLDERVIR